MTDSSRLQSTDSDMSGRSSVGHSQQLRLELRKLFRSYLGPERLNQLELTETCYPPLIEAVQKTAAHIFSWTIEEEKYCHTSSINSASITPTVAAPPAASAVTVPHQPSFVSPGSHHTPTPSHLPQHSTNSQLKEEKEVQLQLPRETDDENLSTSPLSYLLSHLHPHPLRAYKSRYSEGLYRCNLCGHTGMDFVYACDECGYDLHPECFERNCGGPYSDYKTTTPLPNPDPEYKGTERLSADDRVELEFPYQISKALPILVKEGQRESSRMRRLFRENPQFNAHPDFSKQTSFSFQTLDYLLDEFNNRSDPSIPPPLALTPYEGGVCLMIIEVVISTILWTAIQGWEDQPTDRRLPTLRPFDLLLYAIESKELSILIPFLNAPFTIIDLESVHRSIISSSAYWPTTSNENIRIPQPHPFPRTTHFESMLNDTFQPNVEQFKEINSLEWYFDPGQVKQYAQLYAELKLPPGDDYFYRQWGITPIAFYGGTLQGLFCPHKPESEERVFTFSLLHPVSCTPLTFCLGIRCCEKFLSGILWDVESSLLAGQMLDDYKCELDDKWRGKATANGLIVNHHKPSTPIPTTTVSTTDQSQSAVTTKDEASCIMRDTLLAATCSLTTTPIGSSPYHLDQSLYPRSSLIPPHLILESHPLLYSQPMRYFRLRLAEFICNQINLISSDVDPHTHPHTTRPVSEKRCETKKETDSVGDKGEEKTIKDIPTWQQLPQALIATQLFAYELFPTGLWTANHPLSVRHYFTQELIREQSRLAGLPELPNDLLHLIGEYEPAQLPCPPTASTPLSEVSTPSPWLTPAQLVQYDQYHQHRARFISRDCQIDESRATVVRLGPTAS